MGIKVHKNVTYIMQAYRLVRQLAYFQRAYRHVIILAMGMARGKAGALLKEKITPYAHHTSGRADPSFSVTLIEKEALPQRVETEGRPA